MEYIKKDVVLRAIRIASSLEEAYEMIERMEGHESSRSDTDSNVARIGGADTV